jgi:1-deoxy-D-xylulose-5-phosphate reductoisomerase
MKRLGETGLPASDWPELRSGAQARVEAAATPEVDFVMSAIVGVAGLEATYAAARAAGSPLIPVDSEHNGVHQCLRAGQRSEVARIILTASGGPFRGTPKKELASVTPEQALNHPTWKMGKRITIDSATMMNKGFEVIEACWLFGVAPSEVEVVIHPQSSVHAMVEFKDGSVLAQISATDMRMPIQYALTYPARASAPVPRLDWQAARHWDFAPPDLDKFRLLALAYRAQESGGSATCTLNAADEVAVEAFLEERISFPGISEVVEETLEKVPVRQPQSVGEVLEIDEESRAVARGLIRSLGASSRTRSVARV